MPCRYSTGQGIRFGIQLCYDAHFPELSTRMAETDADVIFMPHASPRGQAADKHQSWMRHLPARAFDNGLFVVACNQTGDNENGLVFPGNAVVFSPSGEIMQTRLTGNSGMIMADLTAEPDSPCPQSPDAVFLSPIDAPDLTAT
jgi:predicted amidohydrolase